VAQNDERDRTKGCLINPRVKRRALIEQDRTGLAIATREASRLEMDGEQPQRSLPARRQRDVDTRSKLRVPEHEGSDVAVPLECDALVNRERDCLSNDALLGVANAAGAAGRSFPHFNEDGATAT
jgi:hypothetical protein